MQKRKQKKKRLDFCGFKLFGLNYSYPWDPFISIFITDRKQMHLCPLPCLCRLHKGSTPFCELVTTWETQSLMRQTQSKSPIGQCAVKIIILLYKTLEILEALRHSTNTWLRNRQEDSLHPCHWVPLLGTRQPCSSFAAFLPATAPPIPWTGRLMAAAFPAARVGPCLTQDIHAGLCQCWSLSQFSCMDTVPAKPGTLLPSCPSCHSTNRTTLINAISNGACAAFGSFL